MRRLVSQAGAAIAVAISLAGCASNTNAPRPWRTRFTSKLSTLAALPVADYLVIEGKAGKGGPYHFIIDTGSTATLVSPELASRYTDRIIAAPANPVKVRSAEGGLVPAQPTELSSIQLDNTVFENVPALVFDLSAISAHLGVKIDGILGFPFFRDAVLTLDYPHKRVLLASTQAGDMPPGATIEFTNTTKTPVIPVGLGDAALLLLVDSGSDSALTLNPTGLQPAYAIAPREGTLFGTLSGEHEQMIGRMAGSIRLGEYQLEKPIVELTDGLSSIGGGVLQNFTVTFNQQRNRVTFYREAPGPITFPARRSIGLSFSKESAYWRVVGVVRDSPAAADGIQEGDLMSRINGEPVDAWNLTRLEQAIASSDYLMLSFINGAKETEKKIGVFELVP